MYGEVVSGRSERRLKPLTSTLVPPLQGEGPGSSPSAPTDSAGQTRWCGSPSGERNDVRNNRVGWRGTDY